MARDHVLQELLDVSKLLDRGSTDRYRAAVMCAIATPIIISMDTAAAAVAVAAATNAPEGCKEGLSEDSEWPQRSVGS